MSKIDVRDRFVVARAGKAVQSGSLQACRNAAKVFNDQEMANGRTPDYWVGLNPACEVFKELRAQALAVGLGYEYFSLFTQSYKGD